MHVTLLDSEFKEVVDVDTFKSLIWVDRYWSAGDFEMVLTPSSRNLELLNTCVYVRIPESKHIMLIDRNNLKTNVENGDDLLIFGSSLEKLLKRRIVWETTSLIGNFQGAIQDLLDSEFIDPEDPSRIVTDLVFLYNSDPAVTALSVNNQYAGEYVYDVICELAQSLGCGFRIYRNYDTEQYEFKLYMGKDRTFNQNDNTSVIFSEEFENLKGSEYVYSSEYERTVGLITGAAGIGNIRTAVEVQSPSGPGTGFDRREFYVQTDISRNGPNGELTEIEFLAQLVGKGDEELSKRKEVMLFSGDVDTTQFSCGRDVEDPEDDGDFFIGDILQIADSYGHSGRVRVTEMLYSHDEAGVNKYPKFEYVDN